MEKRNVSEKLVKGLQILSIVFIVVMMVAGIVLMKKYDISVKNAAQFKTMLTGNLFKVALIIIGVNFIKAFALVVPPAVVFVICGLVFENLWVGILVGFLCIATSIAVPFWLGRFTGADMAEKLKNKYPKIKKLDDFADENNFMVVFLVKATGLIPGDVSSLIFGAMGIKFKKFFAATLIGEFPLIVLWTIIGNKGDFNDPKTALYVIPVIVFAVLISFIMKKWTDKKSKEKAQAQAEKIETV